MKTTNIKGFEAIMKKLKGMEKSFHPYSLESVMNEMDEEKSSLSANDKLRILDYMQGMLNCESAKAKPICGMVGWERRGDLFGMGMRYSIPTQNVLNRIEGMRMRIQSEQTRPEESIQTNWDWGNVWNIINANKINPDHQQQFIELIDEHRKGNAIEIAAIALCLFNMSIPKINKGWAQWYRIFCDAIGVQPCENYEKRKGKITSSTANGIIKDIVESGFIAENRGGGDAMSYISQSLAVKGGKDENDDESDSIDKMKVNPDASNHKRGNSHEGERFEREENGHPILENASWKAIYQMAMKKLSPTKQKSNECQKRIEEWAKENEGCKDVFKMYSDNDIKNIAEGN